MPVLTVCKGRLLYLYLFKLSVDNVRRSFALFAEASLSQPAAAHVAAMISISFWNLRRSCIFASIAALSSPFRAVSSALQRRPIAVLLSAGSLSLVFPDLLTGAVQQMVAPLFELQLFQTYVVGFSVRFCIAATIFWEFSSRSDQKTPDGDLRFTAILSFADVQDGQHDIEVVTDSGINRAAPLMPSVLN